MMVIIESIFLPWGVLAIQLELLDEGITSAKLKQAKHIVEKISIFPTAKQYVHGIIMHVDY